MAQRPGFRPSQPDQQQQRGFAAAPAVPQAAPAHVPPTAPPVQSKPSQFHIWCDKCQKVTKGSLRVRCSCSCEAVEIKQDPRTIDDILKTDRIRGQCWGCEGDELAYLSDNQVKDRLQNQQVGPFVQFYFKCDCGDRNGVFLPEVDLNGLRCHCLDCEEEDPTKPVVRFSNCVHVLCVDECFARYASLVIGQNKLIQKENGIWTINCPVSSCRNSVISTAKVFKLLSAGDIERYRNFSTREVVLRSMGGVECPLAGCTNAVFIPTTTSNHLVCPVCRKGFCKACKQNLQNCGCPKEPEQRPVRPAAPVAAPAFPRTDPSELRGGVSITLDIRLQSDRRVTIEVNSKEKVGDMKLKILEKQPTLRFEDLQLIYCGRHLSNEYRIEDLKFSQSTAVHLISKQTTNAEDLSEWERSSKAAVDNQTVEEARRITKPCPKCKAPTSHFYNHHCHHMSCPCGHEWCFECGADWGEECKRAHWFCGSSCHCPRGCGECQQNKSCGLCWGCDVCI